MNVSIQAVLAVIGGAVSVATAIFWGAFYLGRIWNRLDEHDRRLEEHDKVLADLRT